MIRHFAIAAAALIAGCGADAPPEPPPAEQQAGETVFDPMLESLEKAKAVEDLALKRKADIDQRLQQADADDPD